MALPDVVVFDLGEVLTCPPRHLADLAGSIGAEATAFEEAYWAHRLEWDRGLPASIYWAKVAAATGITLTADGAERLTAADVKGWVGELPPMTVPMLRAVAAGPARLGLLSNMSREMSTLIRHESWLELFDEVVFSGEEHVAKPEPAIFQIAADRLGIRGGQRVIFFDDKKANVDAAITFGWQGVLWDGAAAAIATLRDLGLLGSWHEVIEPA